MSQRDVDRVQEYRKCIECFLCQGVCHVIRDHKKHEQDGFVGPRFLVYAAALEMHPLDTADRLEDLKDKHQIGYCTIRSAARAESEWLHEAMKAYEKAESAEQPKDAILSE